MEAHEHNEADQCIRCSTIGSMEQHVHISNKWNSERDWMNSIYSKCATNLSELCDSILYTERYLHTTVNRSTEIDFDSIFLRRFWIELFCGRTNIHIHILIGLHQANTKNKIKRSTLIENVFIQVADQLNEPNMASSYNIISSPRLYWYFDCNQFLLLLLLYRISTRTPSIASISPSYYFLSLFFIFFRFYLSMRRSVFDGKRKWIAKHTTGKQIHLNKLHKMHNIYFFNCPMETRSNRVSAKIPFCTLLSAQTPSSFFCRRPSQREQR